MKRTIQHLVDQLTKLSGDVMFDDSSVGKTACDFMTALLCAGNVLGGEVRKV